ncbi:anaerobic ribonucleoside-triphosphate reductase activating protein [Desulfurococcaceae archaeon MEX13E-LK6-19]|nr:anaerobic ribonucleoside-triphosphate reductase activating protein [Desulfurococcaceae archaeon MEX13E-LK6-19]
MVDVYQAVTFTLWLCGCNLKCPFCHNWKIATWSKDLCRIINEEKLLNELESARLFIDYLHITGGEPLIQWRNLIEFLRKVKENIGVPISINSNLTLFKPLEKILEKDLVDHIATDIKIPPELLYGFNVDTSMKLWRLFIKSLKLVVLHNIPLELRIPVARNISLRYMEKYIDEVLSVLGSYDNYYFIIQPLLGHPITSPRDSKWCSEYCNPLNTTLDNIAKILRSRGIDKISIKYVVEELKQVA